MKKRLTTFLLTIVFVIGAAFPVQAAEEWLYLEHGDYQVSTPLMAGNKVTELYLQVGSASYDVYYEFTDQNGNYLIGGTLYGFDGTIIEFDSPSNRPAWFPADFGSGVTDIQLTLTCSYTWLPCEAYAFVRTSKF